MKNYKRTIFSWSMYDFANQPFTTLVVTFIFGTYFTEVVAENSIIGTFQWSWGISVTALIIAFLSPIMGAIADQGKLRKHFLIFWSLICVVGSLMLYDSVSGKIFYSLFWFVFGNIGFEMGSVFCNAYLPHIAPRNKMGRISGYGWSLGYLGGLVALVICLVFLVYPEKPIFNLSKQSSINSIKLKVKNIESQAEGYTKIYVDTIAQNYKFIKLINFERSDTLSKFETLVYDSHTFDNEIEWENDNAFKIKKNLDDSYKNRNIVLVGPPYWQNRDSSFRIDSTGYVFNPQNIDIEIRNNIYNNKSYKGTLCYKSSGELFLDDKQSLREISNNLSSQNIRFTNILVGIWFLIFSIPTFLYVKDNKVNINRKGILRQSFAQIVSTFKSIKTYKEIVAFLIARIFYNDGLITIFAFGGIYAAGTFGFTFNEIFLFGILLSISAGIGAFVMGFVDDKIGAKTTIQISNIGLIVACLIAVLGSDIYIGSIFVSGKTFLWLSGVIIGLFAGCNQSASRSLMGRLTPKEKQNEFFGFYAFSGKATSFLGPVLLGLVTQFTGSQRYGLMVIILLLIVGYYLLSKVDDSKKSPLNTLL